jgi:hypothetical protein
MSGCPGGILVGMVSQLPPAAGPGPGQCLVCNQALSPPVVWCSSCETAQHQDCFAYNGKCARFGCSSLRYATAPGRKVRGVNWVEKKDPAGRLVPQAYIADFESNRESALELSGWGTFILAFAVVTAFSFYDPVSSYMMYGFFGCLAVSFMLLGIRTTVFDYHVVDGKSKTLYLHEQIMFRKTLTPLASFADCDKLLLRCYIDDTRSEDGSLGYQWALEIYFKRKEPPIYLAGLRTERDPAKPEKKLAVPRQIRSIADRIAWISGLPLEIRDEPGEERS